MLFNRGSQVDGFGFGATLDSAGMAGLGYYLEQQQRQATYNFSSGLYPVLNVWQYVAWVMRINSATIYLYYINPNTGLFVLSLVSQSIALNAYTWNNTTTYIGGDPNGGTAGRVFTGAISDVAVYNSALTPAQILQQFGNGLAVAGFPPRSTCSRHPTSPLIRVSPCSSAANIGGTAPITNQWEFNGTNLVDGYYNGSIITGSTSNVLTLVNVKTNWQGVYNLVLSNSLGSAVSSNANLTIVDPAPPPAANLVGNWLAPLAGNFNDTSAIRRRTPMTPGLPVGNQSYYWTNDVPYGAAGWCSIAIPQQQRSGD